jgi:hypothetical protein
VFTSQAFEASSSICGSPSLARSWPTCSAVIGGGAPSRDQGVVELVRVRRALVEDLAPLGRNACQSSEGSCPMRTETNAAPYSACLVWISVATCSAVRAARRPPAPGSGLPCCVGQRVELVGQLVDVGLEPRLGAEPGGLLGAAYVGGEELVEVEDGVDDRHRGARRRPRRGRVRGAERESGGGRRVTSPARERSSGMGGCSCRGLEDVEDGWCWRGGGRVLEAARHPAQGPGSGDGDRAVHRLRLQRDRPLDEPAASEGRCGLSVRNDPPATSSSADAQAAVESFPVSRT